MAAHRYWRLFCRKNNGDGSFTGLTEVEMATAAAGADVTSTTFAIGSGGYQAGNATSAFNNDFTGDVIQWNGSGVNAGLWVGQDFGAGNEKDIVEVRVRPNKDAAARSFAEFDVQYSDDNATWTTLWSISYTAWVVGTTVTFNPPAAASAYRRWRIFFNGGSWSNAFSIATLEMRTALAGADQCSGGTPSAFENFGTNTPSLAFDSNTSTFYASNNGNNYNWLAYDFGAGVTKQIIEMYMVPRQDATLFKQFPKSLVVQAGSDGINWSPIWTVSTVFQPYSSGGVTFRNPASVSSGSTHRWWGIKVNGIQSGLNFGVDELEIRPTVGGADNTSGGTALATSCFDNNSVALSAFSGTTAEHASDGNAGIGHILIYDYGNGNEKAVPGQLAIKARANGGFNNHNQAPTSFDLVYSDDGHNVTVQQSFTSPATWASAEQRLFGVTAPAAGRRRVLICG